MEDKRKNRKYRVLGDNDGRVLCSFRVLIEEEWNTYKKVAIEKGFSSRAVWIRFVLNRAVKAHNKGK